MLANLKYKLRSLAVAVLVLVFAIPSIVTADSPAEMAAENTEWTFDQGENVWCFTLRQIINEDVPILHVVHDADDHAWQFLTGKEVSADDMMIVSMREIVDHDRSLLEIGDMPPGYRATRASVGEPWEIEKISE